MTDLQPPTPTPDERVLAALSHVSVLLPLVGVIAPIVIWVTQREKSKYVAFQSLQAMVYQLTIIVGWILSWGCYMCSFLGIFAGMFLGAATETTGSGETIAIISSLLPLLVIGVIMLLGFILMIYGVVGAVMAFQGKPFRYIIIGERVERFMQSGQNPAAES
jgi:uncharacterized Tic20 family protein